MGESWPERWTRPPRAFVALAAVFGTALVLLIPPFQSADEPLHFLRAWQITDGVFIVRTHDARGMEYGDFPASLYGLWIGFSHIGFNPDAKVSFSEIRDALRVPLNPDNRMRVTLLSMAHYSPVCYLPQSAGIAFGRAVRANPLVIFYLGREANLLAWILLGYCSLRIAPVLAQPIFLLLLMPMSLYVAATHSADAPTNAVAILFTAMVFQFSALSPPKIIGVTQMAALLALSVALCLCKFAYFPLLLLLLLIPFGNFGKPRIAVAKLALLIAAGIAASIAWISASSEISARIRLTGDISPQGQLHWLSQHPFQTIPLLLETFHQKWWYLLQTYVGLIGWSDMFFPAYFVVGYLLVLLLACWMCGEGFRFPSARRAAAIVMPAVAISFLIIALLSYMYWTPQRAAFIDGLHGRYLIPLSPAVFILIRSAAPRSVSRSLNSLYSAISLGSCVILLVMVCRRFYG
jgi:uncharacterized membrane protein